MNVDLFLEELRNDPMYAGQIVYVHDQPAQAGEFVPLERLPSEFSRRLLTGNGIPALYRHQFEALSAIQDGRDVLLATGTASGKSLCYTLPILDAFRNDDQARALLLFPTKALTQDQFQVFRRLAATGDLGEMFAGVLDGDSPADLRRQLRDHGHAVFTNPDMLHTSIMPNHARWADFFSHLKFVVLDEMHVYNGIFGSNMTHVMTRLRRLWDHYGCHPQIVACSATIANPKELADRLTGRDVTVIDRDTSPRGRRVTVFWNPPRIRHGDWRSRRSANVEAHELMARLIARGIPTITFSKAKMTAEMIYRYVNEKLREIAPGKAGKVTPYRGGYLPEERREIEKRLFNGELLGVSTTPALELGIDVGSLEAAVIVGYPGTRASFFQQAGRAGRKSDDSLVVLVGLDTSVNQYILSEPGYIFERCVEQAVIDPENPFVMMGQLRCATHELPLPEPDTGLFGERAGTVLDVLQENGKVQSIGGVWYHATSEIPHFEVPLREYATADVMIEDVDTGRVLGEVNEYDAEPILHPEAIYMHLGDTYRVQSLDMERRIARVKRVSVDYYTQPLGGTDVSHIDHQLREKAFGTARLYWGEVTAQFRTHAYEKIHFYSLDAISVHDLDLPTLVLETQAFWLVPPEELMEQVLAAGLDVYGGLRGIGYATRMILPLFMTCDTLDFSHTVGSVNSPWNAVFVYERYPLGLGFTEKAYTLMHEILPAVLDAVRNCSCSEGCPCCVGKPLRRQTTWNVERGEASIPSKAASIMILEGILAPGAPLICEDSDALTDTDTAGEIRLTTALRRRLERMREPRVFHPIRPRPEIRTEYPERESDASLDRADVTRRAERRKAFDRDIHRRIAKKLDLGGFPADITPDRAARLVGRDAAGTRPPGVRGRKGDLKPTSFPGHPVAGKADLPPGPQAGQSEGMAVEGPVKPLAGNGGRAVHGDIRPPFPREKRAVRPVREPDGGHGSTGSEGRGAQTAADGAPPTPVGAQNGMLVLGDSLAARARRKIRTKS